MPTKPLHKTPGELLEERRQALASFQQGNAARAAEISERQARADAFAQQAAAYHEAMARGEVEPVERRNPLELLNGAFQQRMVEHQAEERLQRRAIEADPLHQRFLESLPQPPGRNREWVKQAVNAGHEPSEAEAFGMLQDAKQARLRAQKQYDTVAAQPLSQAELAYAQQQLQTAQAAEQGALALFNELAGPVPVQGA